MLGLGIVAVVALLVLVVLLLIGSQIRVDGPGSAVVLVVLLIAFMLWMLSRGQ